MTTTEAPSPLLDTDACAAWLGISPTTLRTWRTRGGGPPAITVGRAVRYDQLQVQAWLDSNTETRTSPG
jgi:predicted DNA-binding transcriptional regulator AlpA